MSTAMRSQIHQSDQDSEKSHDVDNENRALDFWKLLREISVEERGQQDDRIEEKCPMPSMKIIVGIVEDQNLGFFQDLGRNGFQVRQELSFLQQWQIMNLPAVVLGVGAKHRIARCCHQHIIARVDQGGRQD